VALAALPLALNWRAVDRRQFPDAALPEAVAAGLLESAPASAVLFVAGDNDTYPVWYLQQVRGVRPDVTVVTIPLLGAVWYRAELARRWALLDTSEVGTWRGLGPTLRSLAAGALRERRPVAAAVTVPAVERSYLGGPWRQVALVYVDDGTLVGAVALTDSEREQMTARIVGELRPILGARPRRSTDPIAQSMHETLRCAALAAEAPDRESAALLDSLCNRR
jgi:hypothetical protein